MDITWQGHSCFRIKGKGATLLTDPYSESIGYSLGNPEANIVTSSHPHPGHGFTSGVGGEPKIVRGPGEYEISGVFITGIATFHDAEKGQERGTNTVYVIEMEDMKLCHLGDLGHPLSTEQVAEIGSVELLMVPVGEPGIVIPMHFQTEAVRLQLAPVERFLREMGINAGIGAQPRLSITRAGLSEETQVVLLDYQGH